MSKSTGVRQPTAAGSQRSQNSILQENALRLSLKNADDSIAEAETSVCELEGVVAALTMKVITHGQRGQQEQLDKAIARLATERGRIGPYKAERARILAAIEALLPNEAQIQTRREAQQEFAKLADARLEFDRTADRLLKELRQILEKRNQLSGDMMKAAALCDLTLSSGMLDSVRVERLAEMLPEEISDQSEEWHDIFFGNSTRARTYIVCVELLILDEIFSHCGVYSFGDTVRLLEKDASELLRRDRRDPKTTSKFTFRPADLMTAEDWASMVATAKAKGNLIDEELLIARLRFQEDQKTAEAEKKIPNPELGAFSGMRSAF
jgi:hypothetical protein